MATNFNLSPYNPPTSENQRAYDSWNNSLVQATNMANMNPATLAGIGVGQALGGFTGWRLGNMFQDWLDNQRAKRGKKNIEQDNSSIQNQIDYGKNQEINNPQAVSMSGTLINPDAVAAYNFYNGKGNYQDGFNIPTLNEQIANPYWRAALFNQDSRNSIDAINRAGNLYQKLGDPFKLKPYYNF